FIRVHVDFFSFMICLPVSSRLFPYTTLFRSLSKPPGDVVLRPLVLGEGENLLCLAELHHVAQEEEGGVVGNPGRLLHIVGDGDKDRKSTRLNSSHVSNSYAVFCLKKHIDE